jgi:hypothetical protein
MDFEKMLRYDLDRYERDRDDLLSEIGELQMGDEDMSARIMILQDQLEEIMVKIGVIKKELGKLDVSK